MDLMWKHLQIIGDKVKTYWRSGELGDYAVKIEQIYSELQYAKQHMMSAISDSYVNVNEIARLKQENEELKKQLEDVALFKQCFGMTQQTQIGEPV